MDLGARAHDDAEHEGFDGGREIQAGAHVHLNISADSTPKSELPRNLASGMSTAA